ncbi:MAG: VIT and VWA domain-containing protein [Polyangiaceae bacterium]
MMSLERDPIGLFHVSTTRIKVGVAIEPPPMWARGHGRVPWLAFTVGCLLLLSLLARSAAAQVPPAASLQRSVALEARPSGTRDALVSLPLIEERLRVRIDQQYAKTKLQHTYQNESKARQEGRFFVQAGQGASVVGFAYYVGEKRIVGEVFERETARRIYESVTGQGRDPGLAEKQGEGAFSFRVFPIEPAEKKRVEVDVERYLPQTGRTVHYSMPLGSDRADVVVELTDPRRIDKLRSRSHVIAIDRRSNGSVVVRAERPRRPKVTEFELSYVVVEKPWQLKTAVHRDAGEDAYLHLSLAAPPAASSKRLPKDVTIVLDRSGSMSGAALDNAVRAAKRVIDKLAPRDRVNVVAFDDGVDSLFDKPKLAKSAVRKMARTYLDKLKAGGGTDIALALSKALAAQRRDALPDVVLFITDGQSDAKAALRAAKADPGDARVFTVGVGNGVDRPLLSRLAAIKRGRFTFIPSAEALEREVAVLYKKISAPRMVDVTVRVEGVQISRMYPRRAPDLFDGDELSISARVRGGGKAKVIVEGTVEGTRRRFTTALDVPQSHARPWVGRRWADARVQDLLEQIALHGESKEHKTEAIELAVAYNMVTRYTAFLAIPESEVTAEARDALTSARARKRKILQAHKDAVKLSRSLMPPGDPVLSVRAPESAQQVTAYFPFGLVKDLRFDQQKEQWTTRFLVPKDVPDGRYVVRVVMVLADGSIKVARVNYVIDSEAPMFDVRVEVRGDGVKLFVTLEEDAREVRVKRVQPGVHSTVLALTRGGTSRDFYGATRLPPGTHRLLVVATDVARNEREHVVTVTVP